GLRKEGRSGGRRAVADQRPFRRRARLPRPPGRVAGAGGRARQRRKAGRCPLGLPEVPRHLGGDGDRQGLPRGPREDPMSRNRTNAARARARNTLDSASEVKVQEAVSEPIMNEPLGGYLRRQRERRGMSVAELARVTRIPTTSLEAIEAERFD